MGVFIRATKSPDNLLIFTYFEKKGDAAQFGLDTPRDYPFMVIQGKLEYVHGQDVPIRPWMDELYPDIRSNGRVVITPGALHRGYDDGGKSLIRALEPKTITLCIWPLDKDFLVGALGDATFAEEVMALEPDNFEGMYSTVMTGYHESQFDPRTLMPVEEETAQINLVAVENALLNDLRKLNRGDPVPVRGNK